MTQPVNHLGDATEMVNVLVGYLATHADGYEARLGADRARAEHYAARNRATLEALYVKRRIAKDDQIAQAP